MKHKSLLTLLVSSLVLPMLTFADVPARAQVTVTTTEIKTAVPAVSAQITDFRVDEASKGSGHETGAIHIVYSDKSEVVEPLMPGKPAKDGDVDDNETGIAEPKLARDHRTLAWLEDYNGCCQSYPIPLVLAIYQSGRTVLHLRQGQMVWFWEFLSGGKQLVAVWGTTHGPLVGDYQLYDTATGKVIGEAYGNEDTQSLDADAPEWAKQAEKDCDHCSNPGSD